MTTPKSAKDIIKGANRQRRNARINLAGHLMLDLEQLATELSEMQAEEELRGNSPGPPKRLGAKDPLVLKAQEVDAKKDEMADFWLNLVVEQKPFAQWQQFKTDHPERDGHDWDERVGMNFDALVTDFLPLCVVEPELDAEDWAGIYDKAAPGDLRDLGALLYRLHESKLDIPLLPSVSRVMARRAGNLAQQGPGA